MTISRSEQETVEAGIAFGETLESGDVVALCGDLGAGKTHFVKGIARAFGASEDAVTSPTFTLIHEYSGGRLPLYHVDLYRLETETEALAIGLDEYLDGDGVTAVEWADKFKGLMPRGARWVQFRLVEEDVREIKEIV